MHELTFSGCFAGEGTSATVWKGIHKGSDVGKVKIVITTLAIKCFKTGTVDERAALEFQREVEALASLRHKNIVLFHGAMYNIEINRIGFTTGRSQ